MKEPVGFMMNVDIAEKFFLRCIEREAVTKEEKIAILQELVKDLSALKLTEEDLKKQLKGKKVLVVKKGDKHDRSV